MKPPGTVSRCLHVGNVGVRASEESLRNEFGQFGEIEDVKIVHQGGMVCEDPLIIRETLCLCIFCEE